MIAKRTAATLLALFGLILVTHAGAGCGGGDSSTQPDTEAGADGTTADGPTVSHTCGNGVVEPPEECDNGAAMNINGSGCENDCTFTCIAGNPMRDHCDDGNACNGTETCGTDHKCAPGTPLGQGASCATGKFCVAGNCVPGSCGDGVVESPEECDDGNSTNGDGCDNDCKFSCLSTDPTRNCTPADACAGQGTCSSMHTCTPGTPLGDGTACGPSGMMEICKAGICIPPKCGNGVIDPGEQCDPPNGTTCSATCQLITPVVCGDGKIGGTEQCDDGNLFDLDGCDSTCNYEVVSRMTSVSIQGTAGPSFCMPATNRLGAQSITGTALSQLNTPLQTGIDDGTTNIMTQFLALKDLTGVAGSGFSVGVLSAKTDPAKGAWPSGNPIDWWFFAAHTTVSMGLPTGVLAGNLAARNLTAGPSNVSLTLLLGGSPAVLQMRNATLAATIDGTPAPNVPAPPPAQLAPGLTVFQQITGSGTNQGLCGNITVDSLAQIPIPQVLTTGASACGTCAASRTYTYCGAGNPVGPNCNSLLDALVGGCQAVLCLVTAINPEQPDVPSGAAINPLALGANNKVPASQSTGDLDAYSSYLKFDANRAHFTGQDCAVTADCQTGKTCTANKCQ